jgi:glyoxylase-like metal-dependent hydrolase (beta-lactamase superfamily II)
LRIGDRIFEVMHTPGHSNDSICLYCERDGVLFSGDTPMRIQSAEETHDARFVAVLKNLSCRRLTSIYFGHGNPELRGAKALVCSSVENIRAAEARNPGP